MKKINYPIFAMGIAAVLSLQSMAQETKHAVSIVFTDQSNRTSVDAIIPASEEHLSSLLNQHQLSKDDVHLIRMHDQLPWTEKAGQERKEIMIIQTEDENDGESTSTRIIQVDGEPKELEDLSDEERELIEQQLDNHARQREIEEARQVEKTIEIKNDGDGEDREVRVEMTIENGVEQARVWVNGEELEEEEVHAFLKEHEGLGEPKMQEQEFVFVSEDEEVKNGKIMVKRQIEVETSSTPKKAVVVVKEIKFDATLDEGSSDMIKGDLKLYPNPARDVVQLQFDGTVKGWYEMNISTIQGRVVLSKEGKAKGKVNDSIDLQDLEAGTYIITLSHPAGVSAKKLVVE